MIKDSTLLLSEWVSEWVSALCTRPTHLVGFFNVLAHWNNSPRINISLNFFPSPSQPVCFLLNAACLSEKQQIPISLSLIWPIRGSNLPSTATLIEVSCYFPIQSNGGIPDTCGEYMTKGRCSMWYIWPAPHFCEWDVSVLQG